jgi:hypothetical protein
MVLPAEVTCRSKSTFMSIQPSMLPPLQVFACRHIHLLDLLHSFCRRCLKWKTAITEAAARTEIGLYLLRYDVSIDNSHQTANDHQVRSLSGGLRCVTPASESTRLVVAESQMPSTSFPHRLVKFRGDMSPLEPRVRPTNYQQ